MADSDPLGAPAPFRTKASSFSLELSVDLCATSLLSSCGRGTPDGRRPQRRRQSSSCRWCDRWDDGFSTGAARQPHPKKAAAPSVCGAYGRRSGPSGTRTRSRCPSLTPGPSAPTRTPSLRLLPRGPLHRRGLRSRLRSLTSWVSTKLVNASTFASFRSTRRSLPTPLPNTRRENATAYDKDSACTMHFSLAVTVRRQSQ